MRLVTLGVYLLCGVVALILTLWSHRHPEKLTPPGTLLDTVMESRSARLAVIVFWWWIGWHFLFAQTVDP